MNEIYLITNTPDQGQHKGRTLFYAIDSNSGGYPYWTSYLGHAKFFQTEQDAVKEMRKEIIDAKPSKMCSGTEYPASIIHSALGLCYTTTKGTSAIRIVKVELKVLSENYISGEITHNPK